MRRNLKILPKFNKNARTKSAQQVLSLEMRFGDSTHIFAGIGENFSNLKHLKIEGRPYKWSAGYEGLTELIARSDFVNLTQLKTLDLSQSPIKFAGEDVFWELESLEALNMKNCKLKKLPQNVFKNLKALREIKLGYNKLTYLHRNLFAEKFKLVTIELEKNQLQTIDVDFMSLPNIEVIDLINNVCINEKYQPQEPESSTVSSVQGLQDKINQNCDVNYS